MYLHLLVRQQTSALRTPDTSRFGLEIRRYLMAGDPLVSVRCWLDPTQAEAPQGLRDPHEAVDDTHAAQHDARFPVTAIDNGGPDLAFALKIREQTTQGSVYFGVVKYADLPVSAGPRYCVCNL